MYGFAVLSLSSGCQRKFAGLKKQQSLAGFLASDRVAKHKGHFCRQHKVRHTFFELPLFNFQLTA